MLNLAVFSPIPGWANVFQTANRSRLQVGCQISKLSIKIDCQVRWLRVTCPYGGGRSRVSVEVYSKGLGPVVKLWRCWNKLWDGRVPLVFGRQDFRVWKSLCGLFLEGWTYLESFGVWIVPGSEKGCHEASLKKLVVTFCIRSLWNFTFHSVPERGWCPHVSSLCIYIQCYNTIILIL